MSSLDTLRLAKKRLNILPERSKSAGPNRISPEAREVAEAYYRCSVEVAKVIYTAIDRRYSDRGTDEYEGSVRRYRFAMEDAKRVLNDARNDVLEAVLPLFEVKKLHSAESATEDDLAAHDFIIKNVYEHMIRTFKAYIDVFADAASVETLSGLIDKVAESQKVRLEGWLANYSFTCYTDDLKNRIVKNRK